MDVNTGDFSKVVISEVRVGISGHQRLSNSEAWPWVRQEMRDQISALSQPVIGITSLAVGADSLFAEIVLELGGTLEVIVPFSDYETRFKSEEDRENYRRLLARAEKVEILQADGTDEEAYYAAGKRVADLSDLLVLVWEGRPAAGLGGTADIAEYARQCHKSMIHINPLVFSVTRTN